MIISLSKWPTACLPRQKGGEVVGNTKMGKGTKIMLMVDGEGIPLPVFITSANHAEVNTVETLTTTECRSEHRYVCCTTGPPVPTE